MTPGSRALGGTGASPTQQDVPTGEKKNASPQEGQGIGTTGVSTTSSTMVVHPVPKLMKRGKLPIKRVPLKADFWMGGAPDSTPSAPKPVAEAPKDMPLADTKAIDDMVSSFVRDSPIKETAESPSKGDNQAPATDNPSVGPILQEVPAGQIVKDAGPKGAEMTSLAVGEDASTAPAQNTPLPAEKIKFVQENMAKCQKRVQGQMTECQKLLVDMAEHENVKVQENQEVCLLREQGAKLAGEKEALEERVTSQLAKHKDCYT
ncbi:hypothetical protein PVAP13_8NG347700 [Panicum virgatum]|uniref:Uncharacterized protein n=1 Tax=Panicum virgatum TaxID=38727 RepID=A0A8T0PHQ7_PANVG|nr:hypothetical protein PVAP13_8NG347700 [Panicum virgatum]KAG2558707.1 hypothetical protein PVAP13_8NG347700 [Panicum virgatum]